MVWYEFVCTRTPIHQTNLSSISQSLSLKPTYILLQKSSSHQTIYKNFIQ
nr:MAG TPA: Replication factor A protein 3, heterotrimer, DNA binding, OB-fold.7A [Bacteriophage sp.]